MSSVLAESTCRHCNILIRKIAEHPNDPGRWYHIDGHHAHIECRGLTAEPPAAFTYYGGLQEGNS